MHKNVFFSATIVRPGITRTCDTKPVMKTKRDYKGFRSLYTEKDSQQNPYPNPFVEIRSPVIADERARGGGGSEEPIPTKSHTF
jgi:hypothetical protein